MAYEKARSLLSAQRVEELLLMDEKKKKSSTSTIVADSTCNGAYWNWPAQEDDYWNMRPLPASVVAVAPFKGYWDW